MTTKQLTAYERKETLRDFLGKNKNAIAECLPKFMTTERLIGQLMTNINANPKLLEVSPRSLIGALLYCGSLGLEPSALGHVYLIPFANRQKGTTECQIIVGYKGLAMLARRSEMIDCMNAGVVYEGDEFDWEDGTSPFVKHKPDPSRTEFGNPDDILYAWASYRIKGSTNPQITVLSKNKISWHRDRYSKAKDKGPWVDNFESMALKTAIRINMKLAPMQTEMHSAIALDEMAESQLSQSSFMPELPKALDEKLQEIESEEVKEIQDESVTPGLTIPQWAPTSVKGRTIEELSPAQQKTFAKTLKKRLKVATPETNPNYGQEATLLLAIEEKLGTASATVKEAATEPHHKKDEVEEPPVDEEQKAELTMRESLALVVDKLKITPNGRWIIVDILDKHHIESIKKATDDQVKILIDAFDRELKEFQAKEIEAEAEEEEVKAE